MISDACTSSLPNMDSITNNTLPNSFELKDNSSVQKWSLYFDPQTNVEGRKAANALFNWMEVPNYVCKQSGSWLIYVRFSQLMSNEGDPMSICTCNLEIVKHT